MTVPSSSSSSQMGMSHNYVNAGVKTEPISPPPHEMMQTSPMYSNQQMGYPGQTSNTFSMQSGNDLDFLGTTSDHQFHSNQSYPNHNQTPYHMNRMPSSSISNDLNGHFQKNDQNYQQMDNCMPIQNHLYHSLPKGDNQFNSNQPNLSPNHQQNHFQQPHSCLPQTSNHMPAVPANGCHPYQPVRSTMSSPNGAHLDPRYSSSNHQFTNEYQNRRDYSYQPAPSLTCDFTNVLNNSIGLYHCHRDFDSLYMAKKPRLAADDWLCWAHSFIQDYFSQIFAWKQMKFATTYVDSEICLTLWKTRSRRSWNFWRHRYVAFETLEDTVPLK